MLNFDKIQKDFLTAALKTEKRKSSVEIFNLTVDEENKKAYITNGSFFMIMPDDMRYVRATDDHRFLKIPVDTFKNMEKTIENIRYSKENRLTDTGTTIKKSGLKDTYHVFRHENGDDIWINEKYLSYFDKMDNLEYYGEGKKNPMGIYYYDMLIGVILPVNH